MRNLADECACPREAAEIIANVKRKVELQSGS